MKILGMPRVGQGVEEEEEWSGLGKWTQGSSRVGTTQEWTWKVDTGLEQSRDDTGGSRNDSEEVGRDQQEMDGREVRSVYQRMRSKGNKSRAETRDNNPNAEDSSSSGDSDLFELEEGMFDGLTAWFSSSVSKHRIQEWRQHGGEIRDFDTAMYIFSENANCEDTKSIYETEDYLGDSLAVFHAVYIDECMKKEDVKSVVIGKYFLPPAAVQNEIKDRFHFQWETKELLERNSPKKKPNHSKERSRDIPPSDNKSKSTSKVPPIEQGIPPQQEVVRQSHPSEQRQPETTSRSDVSTKRRRILNTEVSTPLSTADSAEILKNNCTVLLSEYIDISSLTFEGGCLRDFTPGQNGCVVTRKQPS